MISGRSQGTCPWLLQVYSILISLPSFVALCASLHMLTTLSRIRSSAEYFYHNLSRVIRIRHSSKVRRRCPGRSSLDPFQQFLCRFIVGILVHQFAPKRFGGNCWRKLVQLLLRLGQPSLKLVGLRHQFFTSHNRKQKICSCTLCGLEENAFVPSRQMKGVFPKVRPLTGFMKAISPHASRHDRFGNFS